MAEAVYNLYIMWVWKRNCSKAVGMSAQPQTARLCRLRHVLTHWDKQLTVSCAWRKLRCLWWLGRLYDNLQVFRALFSKVFCAEGLCLLYFHRKKEVFKSSSHLLSRVWWIVGCSMSLRANFLDSHLHFLPENFGAVRDEHGKRFPQDIFTLQKRYEGKWSPSVLADLCLTLIREVPQAKCSRMSPTVTFKVTYTYILSVIQRKYIFSSNFNSASL